MRKNNGRKGFTLIELMIVIAIIIILAAVAIPNYLRMTERAKKAAIESDLKALATALETYQTDWGTYPDATTWAGMKAELLGTGGTGTLNVSGETNLLGEAGGNEYITEAALTAIEDKTDTQDYDISADTGYTVTLTADIGGTPTTFTCTAGGAISISG